jgi:hypothetical protein
MKPRTTKNPNEVIHKLHPTHNILLLVKWVLTNRRNNQFTLLYVKSHGGLRDTMVLPT